MRAFVFLIVERWNAEWDAATSKPKSENTAKKADEPCKCAFFFINVCHSHLSTSMAGNLNWMFWPNLRVSWMTAVLLLKHDNLRLLWSSHHVLDRLTIGTHWLLQWLTIWTNLNRVWRCSLSWWITRLLHIWLRLSIRLWLLVHHNWLTFRHEGLLVIYFLIVTHLFYIII